MEKYALSLISLIAIASLSQSRAQIPTSCTVPVDALLLAPQVVTTIQFYIQAKDTGGNETAYRIANSSITNTSPTEFGSLNMGDYYLTETSDPNSNTVGRAQGLFGSCDLNETVFFNDYIALFTSGAYNGSTLHVVGRVPVQSSVQELSISGGTQCFRLATGIVTYKVVSYNSTLDNAIIEVNATVIHPVNIV